MPGTTDTSLRVVVEELRCFVGRVGLPPERAAYVLECSRLTNRLGVGDPHEHRRGPALVVAQPIDVLLAQLLPLQGFDEEHELLGVEGGDQSVELSLFLADVAAVGRLGSRVLSLVGGDVRSPAAPGALVVRTERGLARGEALCLLGTPAFDVALGPTFPPRIAFARSSSVTLCTYAAAAAFPAMRCTAWTDDCVT
ncbi:hypothetical protein ACFY7K_17620 [Streptomyces althioticus]|uniref:hypothetical protein n=1 Tax=Streptomyces althioticus TaxID=83380 RepID=UPI00368B7FF0